MLLRHRKTGNTSRRLIALSVMCLTFLGLWAIPLDSLFVQIPNTVLPQLSTSVRLDMLDYWNAGQTERAVGTTVMLSDVRLVAKDDTCLTLQLSPTCTWQLLRLKTKRAEQYVILETPSNGLCGTFATNYDSRWQPSALSLPPVPAAALCTLPDSLAAEKRQALQEALQHAAVCWTWNSEKCALTAQIATATLTAETKEAVQCNARELTAQWNGKTFALQPNK